MIKYLNYAITLAEVPDEISLTFSITNCGGHCEGCHSPELREDIGRDLEKDLPWILNQYKDEITCVCFLGDGNDYYALNECIDYVHFHGLKTCLYTGKEYYQIWGKRLSGNLDYLKVGPYIRELGGLNNRNTNQRMYHNGVDVTYKFWPK